MYSVSEELGRESMSSSKGSVFPRRSRSLEGDCYGKSLPRFFPDRPVMFVSHNLDSISKHDEALELKGGDGDGFLEESKTFSAPSRDLKSTN
jgi:hypothetical protein